MHDACPDQADCSASLCNVSTEKIYRGVTSGLGQLWPIQI